MNLRARVRNAVIALVAVVSLVLLVFNVLYITFWRHT